jgi:hypothetical protein
MTVKNSWSQGGLQKSLSSTACRQFRKAQTTRLNGTPFKDALVSLRIVKWDSLGFPDWEKK